MWMDEAKYLDDCYNKEFVAKVVEVNGKFIVLDKTYFYPNSGGQPNDEGVIFDEDGNEYNVVFVAKFNDHISHEVDKLGFKVGMKVTCKIDWDRRYKLMKYHSAMHILAGFIFKEFEVICGGNNIGIEKSRIDFMLDDFNRDLFFDLEKKANLFIKESHKINKYILSREEAYKDESLFRITKSLPEDLDRIRIVDIVGFDKQACGGTHLDNVNEINNITILKLENKGKNNRRMYFKVD